MMRRFDDINLQRLGMACALAGMEPTEYAKFQEVAAQEEVEVRKIIGEQHSAVTLRWMIRMEIGARPCSQF